MSNEQFKKKEELLKDKGVSDALKKHVDDEDKGVTKCDTLKWGIMEKLGRNLRDNGNK